jgi:polar amino acid transport system permease protein
LGTVLGAGLALLRLSASSGARALGGILTNLTRNVPTFVFLYYLAYLLPTEIAVGDTTLVVPPWLKAALALSIAVVGFASDGLLAAMREWHAGRHAASLLFVPSWTSYFVIVLMASSTASVIGVGEIVSRCNTVIGAVGRTELMLWIYLYAMLWFFAVSLPVTLVMRRTRARMQARLGRVVPA